MPQKSIAFGPKRSLLLRSVAAMQLPPKRSLPKAVQNFSWIYDRSAGQKTTFSFDASQAHYSLVGAAHSLSRFRLLEYRLGHPRRGRKLISPGILCRAKGGPRGPVFS